MKRRWLVASILLAGCARPAGAASASLVRRDSAGTEVVENTRTISSLPVWRINPSALTNVGGDPSTFSMAIGARQLGDGSIMVADAQAALVTLFDSTGRLIRVLGRKGQGPAEFTMPGPPTRLGGDTTYVFDQGSGRLVLFSGPDLVPTTVTPRRPGIPLIPSGWITRDTGIAAAVRMPEAISGRFRTSIPFVRFTMHGAIVDTIVVGKGFEGYAESPGAGGKTGVRYNLVAMGSQTHAVTADRRLYVVETSEAEFKTFDLARNATRIVRWAAPPDHVTAADRRDLGDRMVARWRNEDDVDHIRIYRIEK